MSLIMSKSNVRINDLARELEIKSRHVLEFLRERGINGYPNQHIHVIHQGDWIEDVGRALKDR